MPAHKLLRHRTGRAPAPLALAAPPFCAMLARQILRPTLAGRLLTSGQPLAARHASSGGKLPPKGMPVWNYSEWYMSARTNPAIEKYVKYKEDFHLRFRYTPQVAFDSVLWCVIVPFGVFSWIKKEAENREISALALPAAVAELKFFFPKAHVPPLTVEEGKLRPRPNDRLND